MSGLHLTAVERQALEFLVSQGSDQIGEIDTDGKLAAAVVFSQLVQKGAAIVSKSGDDHPVFHPTRLGRSAIENLRMAERFMERRHDA